MLAMPMTCKWYPKPVNLQHIFTNSLVFSGKTKCFVIKQMNGFIFFRIWLKRNKKINEKLTNSRIEKIISVVFAQSDVIDDVD